MTKGNETRFCAVCGWRVNCHKRYNVSTDNDPEKCDLLVGGWPLNGLLDA